MAGTPSSSRISGLPDPLTTKISMATTDANDVPLFIQLPVGFLAGANDWIEVDDSASLRVFSASVEGQVFITSPTASSGTLGLANNGTTARVQIVFGNAISNTTLQLRPAATRSAVIEILNADTTPGHTFAAGAAVGGGTLGFYGANAATQPAAVANASGGAIIDAEARTALNALLARMRTLGLIAT